MIRILAALTGLFILLATPVSALDLYTVPQTEIQQKLDDKLPISTKPNKLKLTGMLLPGATIHLNANGTINMDGAFEIRHETAKAFFRGRFAATTNLLLQEDGIHLDRIALEDFEGELIAPKTGNKLKDSIASIANKGIEKTLNRPGTTRDILALLLLKQLEEKPIVKFDGSKPWHLLVKQALATGALGANSISVTENLLTIRSP